MTSSHVTVQFTYRLYNILYNMQFNF